MKKTFTLVAAICGLMSAKAQKPFTPGNIVIYKVGDSTNKLTNTRVFPVTLEEHSIADVLSTKKAPVVNSISLPSRVGSASGKNRLLSASGSTNTEGQMTRSTDGNYLVFAGYDAGADTSKVGFANLSSSTDRIIGTVDKNGTINTSTIISRNITNTVTKAGVFTGLSPRSVVSTDGSHFYFMLSNAGIYSETLGDSSSTKKISLYSKTKAPGGSPTARSLEIYDNTLYSSYASSYIPTNTVGDPVLSISMGSLGSVASPDTFVTTLPGIDTIYKSTKVTKTSPYQFLIVNLSGGKVLYIADDATSGVIVERGIQKYSLVSGTWVYNGSIYASGVRCITGINQGDNVALFATSTKNLYGTLDLGGFNNKPVLPPLQDSAIILDTAVANTAFRGVAFTPGTPPLAVTLRSSLTASVIKSSAVLSWATASETNNKNFVIEKSLDGKSYAAIKTLLANNKPSTYTFTDPSKLNAVQYYRLKMTSNDGSFTYSGVATVTNKVSVHIGVSPNPVISNATISHSLATSGATLKITTILGKTVATYPVQVGATQTSVDVARLTSGSYIVSYVNGGSTTTTQFVK